MNSEIRSRFILTSKSLTLEAQQLQAAFIFSHYDLIPRYWGRDCLSGANLHTNAKILGAKKIETRLWKADK